MVCKINDAEQSQLVAELRQRIAELEISNQEYHTTNEIANKAVQPTSPIENGGRSEEVGLYYFIYICIYVCIYRMSGWRSWKRLGLSIMRFAVRVPAGSK